MQITTKNFFYVFILNLIVAIVSALSGLYIALNDNVAWGYELLYWLPLVFGLCFILLLSKPLLTSRSIFLWTFVIFATLRYLVLPILMINQNYFTGLAYYAPHSSSVNKGILLMLYEIIVSSILIRCIYKKNLYKQGNIIERETTKYRFSIKNKFVYLTFILFSIIFLLFNLDSLKGISFFLSFNRRSSEEQFILSSLSVHFIMLAKLLLYFIIVDKLHIKYLASRKGRYLVLTYLISFLNIGIFPGVNRKQILMNAVSSMLVINSLYPKQRRRSSMIMLALAFMIFFQLTVFRFYSNTDRKLFGNTAGTLQVYLSGPYNMALAVETRDEFKDDISAFNVVYDLGRPFYGVGQYFKKFNTYTSTEYFNRRLSIGGSLRSDQIMPITGQGLLHFGYIFSPIYLVLSIIFGFYAEKKFRQTDNLEKRYVLSLICMILGQAMGINFIIITNFITFEGVLFYIINYINSRVGIRKQNDFRWIVKEGADL